MALQYTPTQNYNLAARAVGAATAPGTLSGLDQVQAGRMIALTGGPYVLPDFAARSAQISGTKAEAGLLEAQTSATRSETRLRQQLFDALFGEGGIVGDVRDILGGIGGGVGGGDFYQPGFAENPSSLSLLDEYGAGRRASVEQAFQSRASTALGQLQASNLAVDTVVPSILAGIEREQQLVLGELGDQIIGKKVDVNESALERQFGARESALDRQLQVQEGARDRQVSAISALSGLFGGLF